MTEPEHLTKTHCSARREADRRLRHIHHLGDAKPRQDLLLPYKSVGEARGCKPLIELERARRFERPTLTLARLCSTPELRPLSPMAYATGQNPYHANLTGMQALLSLLPQIDVKDDRKSVPLAFSCA